MLLKDMTMVRLDWMLGFMLLTAVVLTVRGLGEEAEAVKRLAQEVVVTVSELSKVQDSGVRAREEG